MRIGIDIDDTITDSYDMIFNYAQEYTINTLGRSGKIVENDKIDNHFYAKDLHNWSEQEEQEYWKKYYKKIVMEVKPKTLAIEYMDKLRKEGHELVLITARFQLDEFDVENLTRNWLLENQIPYDKLIVNALDKLKIAKEEGIDIFIDDSYRNCKTISDYGIKTYLMDSRVNKSFQDDKITRIYSWPHFYQEIKNRKGE